jgi:hypothetical protein
MVMIAFCLTTGKAQTFNSATSTETTYPIAPSAPTYFLDENITYLHNSSIFTPYFYAPPVYSGTASAAAWSHKMYVNSSGFSATDGGGFALGVVDLSGNYTGLVTTAMPNASNICAAAIHGLCQENVIVVYAQPCGDSLIEGCNPYCNYYYQLYHWAHPSSLIPIGSPVALSSCSFFDRISIDINGEGNKAAVVWGHNNSALFSKAFDFSGATISVGPTVLLTNKGNLADVAFRKDPATGTEYLHYGYFSYLNRTDCELTYHNDEDLGLSNPTFVHHYTSFGSIMSGTFSGFSFGFNYEPTYFAGRVDDVNLVIDAPDQFADPNWCYTWHEKGDDKVYLHTYKDGVSGISDPSWLANDGIITSGFAPRFTPGTNPTLGYHPTGSNYFTGFVGGPNGYVADQINDLGVLMSTNDYLDIPLNGFSSGLNPLVSLSKNSSGNYHYTVFGQKDVHGDYSLVHKGHPWTSSSTWRQTDPNPLITPASAEETQLDPIPFDNYIKLSVPAKLSNEQWKLNITDVLGKSIFMINGTPSQINTQLNQKVRELSSGTYIVQTLDPLGNKKHFKAIKK